MKPSFIDTNGCIDFHKLYATYYAPFCIYAKRFIDDGDVRQDIVQEVFVSLWNKFEGTEVDADAILSYIKVCVRNGCLNHIEHQRHVAVYADARRTAAPPYADSADSLYTLEEMYARLNDIVAAMPEAQRIVFEQTVIDNRNYAEVAEQIGCSVKSVGRYRQRIMQILKRDMKEYLPLLLLCYNISAQVS